MSADRELQDDYQEWRRLAEAEGAAVSRGDWLAVEACQGALRQLQDRINEHTALARQEWERSGIRAARERYFRALVGSLLEIGHRNSALLAERRAQVRAEMEKLGMTGLTLKQVHKSYAPPSPAVWTSFS
jgi:hypothetical protein